MVPSNDGGSPVVGLFQFGPDRCDNHTTLAMYDASIHADLDFGHLSVWLPRNQPQGLRSTKLVLDGWFEFGRAAFKPQSDCGM